MQFTFRIIKMFSRSYLFRSNNRCQNETSHVWNEKATRKFIKILKLMTQYLGTKRMVILKLSDSFISKNNHPGSRRGKKCSRPITTQPIKSVHTTLSKREKNEKSLQLTPPLQNEYDLLLLRSVITPSSFYKQHSISSRP